MGTIMGTESLLPESLFPTPCFRVLARCPIMGTESLLPSPCSVSGDEILPRHPSLSALLRTALH